jgi:hypothetical protein
MSKESKLVILRREFLHLCQGNFCAAKLIEYFKNWTSWKIQAQRTPWIYQPLKRIHADLMGEHSLHVIREAIAFLESINVISKRKNPSNKQDKTYQYCLNFNILELSLKNESPEFRSESSEFRSERSGFNVEQHHRIYSLEQPLSSDPTDTAVGEGSVFQEVEPNWDKLAKETAQWEASQLGIEIAMPNSTNFAEITDPNNTLNPENLNEGHSPALNDNKNHLQKIGFAGVEFKVEEPQAQSSGAVSKVEGEDAVDSIVPSVTTLEMRDITNQLRGIKCTPAFQINPQVQDCIKKNWQNVPNAIAYIKEQVTANIKPKKTWEAWFVYAVTNGLKSEKGCVPTGFVSWFDDAYNKGLIIASEQRADGAIGVCLAEKIAIALGVGQWVRFEKAVELLCSDFS